MRPALKRRESSLLGARENEAPPAEETSRSWNAERPGAPGGTPGTSSRCLRLVKLYLEMGMKLCQDNPLGERDGFGPSVRYAKLPFWSHLAQAFYGYFTLKLIANIVLQHNYNLLAWELEPAAQGREQNRSLVKSGAKWLEGGRQRKRAELELTEARLRLLGSAYYELGVVVEPLFMFIAYAVYLSYVQPLLYVALRGPVIFGVLRAFVDPERERRQIIEPEIAHRVREFVESSLNYLLARREQILRRASRDGWRLPLGQRQGESHLVRVQRTTRELHLAHERSVRTVANLLASGDLMPPNRKPKWVEQLAKIYLALIANFGLSTGSLVLSLAVVAPALGLLRPRTEPRDLLFQAELVLYCLLAGQWIGFHLVVIVVSSIDQIKFVHSIRALVDEIRLACQTDTVEEAPPPLPPDHPRPPPADPNRALIRMLLLYKLLTAHLASTQTVVGFVGANLVVSMFVLPVLALLYLSTLSAGARYSFLACSLFGALSCNIILLPTCYVHARCLDLFRALSFMLAHIEARRQRQRRLRTPTKMDADEPADRHTYDEHTVWLVRRELSMPELAASRFAIDAFFLRLTYSSFLGVHFWFGLLLAPLLVQDTAHLSGSLLTNSLKFL